LAVRRLDQALHRGSALLDGPKKSGGDRVSSTIRCLPFSRFTASALSPELAPVCAAAFLRQRRRATRSLPPRTTENRLLLTHSGLLRRLGNRGRASVSVTTGETPASDAYCGSDRGGGVESRELACRVRRRSSASGARWSWRRSRSWRAVFTCGRAMSRAAVASCTKEPRRTLSTWRTWAGAIRTYR
jgi:hypothetical protein